MAKGSESAGLLGFLRNVVERAAANWLAAIGLAAGAIVLGLLWRFAAFLRTPVPLYVAIVGVFLGIAVGAAITAAVSGVWPGRERKAQIDALVVLQKAGGDKVYAERLRGLLGLERAPFDLLLHGLLTNGYVYDSAGDVEVWPHQERPRTLSILGAGRTLLQRELRRRPDLFS